MISLAFGVALAFTPQAPPPEQSFASQPTAERGARADVSALLLDLNALRAARGLRPLLLDRTLCSVAREHGLDMARRGYFDHTSPEGETPFDRLDHAHLHYGYAGENLALDVSAEAANRALLASIPHRRNMLEPHYARVGIAAVASQTGTLYVEDFSD